MWDWGVFGYYALGVLSGVLGLAVYRQVRQHWQLRQLAEEKPWWERMRLDKGAAAVKRRARGQDR